ncbi:hypothetical protein DK842_17970 [Chromobacterium phragmitis]|nr:hypothetical protein [Chromobacterium phragmitis]AXE31619.1 hypothetical protein DK842_17970 [Chromobacterium phragmitis]
MRLHHTTIVYEAAPWGRGAELVLITGTRCRVVAHRGHEITVRLYSNNQIVTFTRRALANMIER